MNTNTKLLRIGTQLYSSCMYMLPISNSIFTSNTNIEIYVTT